MLMVKARRKKLRDLVGLFKDKASLIKIILSMKRTSSSIHVAILRCTTHSSITPPLDHRINAVLSLGNGSRPTAGTCIEAIMDRLHNTKNAYVALKCLITLHNIISRGSFILKDQISFYPVAGGRNFLNLLRFMDKSDVDTWEFSSWVRWYGGVLERNLMTSRVLGSYFSFSFLLKRSDFDKEAENLTSLLNSDLLRETEALVSMVEEISYAPESLHFQKNNLVYEVVKLVSEDYRLCQYHIMIRLNEFGDRIEGLSSSELSEVSCSLERLEASRERLSLLFANRKRNVVFWDLVSQTKMMTVEQREDREKMLVTTRYWGPSHWLRLLPSEGKS